MVAFNITIFLIAAPFGYLVGRWGDNYLNIWFKDPGWVPDHWVYGLVLMLIGSTFFKRELSIIIFSFGLGLVISDLKDLLKLKFWGSDNKIKGKIKFWHID